MKNVGPTLTLFASAIRALSRALWAARFCNSCPACQNANHAGRARAYLWAELADISVWIFLRKLLTLQAGMNRNSECATQKLTGSVGAAAASICTIFGVSSLGRCGASAVCGLDAWALASACRKKYQRILSVFIF